MYLQYDELPGCCGIIVISDFDYDIYFKDNDEIEAHKDNIEDCILNIIHNQRKYTFKIIATTSNEQMAAVQVLRKLKFRESKWYKSKNHYTKVKFWQLDL